MAALGAAFGLALGLTGCSSVPDALNPVEWARSVGTVFDDEDPRAADAKARAERRPVPGLDRPFPNLSSVPGRPAVAPVGDRDRIAQGLRADRENARYADDAVRRPPAAAPIAASAVGSRPNPGAIGPGGVGAGATVAQASLPARLAAEPTPPVRSADPVMAAPAPAMVAPSSVAAAPRPPVSREVLQAQAAAPAAGPSAAVTSVPAAAAVPAVPPRAAVPEPQASVASTPRAAERQVAARSPAGRDATTDPAAQGVSYRAAVIYFDQDSSSLSAEDAAAIREVARFHRQTGGRVRVVGHAAGDAAVTSGQRLRDATLRVSTARAEAVARQLVQFGVPQRSVAVRGAGEGEPMVRDGTADAVTRNRRAEIYIDY